MKTKTCFIIACSLFALAPPAQASDDNARDIAKQLQVHRQAEERLLHGFAIGNHAQVTSAAVDIAAAEAYLQVSGFSGNDPRLMGGLFMRYDNPESFSAKVFDKKLHNLTNFQIAPVDAFSQVDWNDIGGAQ